MVDSSDRGPLDAGSPVFPSGFGHFDRPAPPSPDPTAESFRSVPAADPADAADSAAVPAEPSEPPPPPLPPGLSTAGPASHPLPPSQLPQPEFRGVPPEPARVPSSHPKLTKRVWVGIGTALAILAAPVIIGVWSASNNSQRSDNDFSGFDLDGSTEPLVADELYSEPSYTFEIKLSDRVMEGDLTLIEAFDHPDCDSAAVDEPTRRLLAGCEHQIEAAYTTAYEGVRVSQQVLMFDEEASAESFAAALEGEFAGYRLSFAHQPDFSEDFDEGWYAATRVGARGVFVVVTLMVSEAEDEPAITAAEEHAHARHAESLSYFIWR